MAQRILIVDDDKGVREFLAELFLQQKWQVNTAEDGKQGIQQASEIDYDIILMDLIMPRVNGLEAIREIIKLKPDSKIIVITGSQYKNMISQAISSGAKLFVKKPFSAEKMLTAVKSLHKES
ncbi:chemotaxis protein CheY [bacterium BMS3Bbin04]|nr:chemotaxis protein CheY [bacterium BMS3Bbin04]